VVIEEDFDHLSGDTNINFMFDVFVRAAVKHFFYGNMIVELNGRDLPGG